MNDSDFKRFELTRQGEVAILALIDPRLAETLLVNELEEELLGFLEDSDSTKVVIDFTTVRYCSSSVVNGLIRGKNSLSEQQGQMNLCCMHKSIRSVFRLLNLEGTVFDIYATVDEAAASF